MLDMKLNNDNLNKLYQAYVSSKTPDNRNKCPSPMDLFTSFSSTTTLQNKKNIIDHITACSYCREEFELLLELKKWQLASGASSPDKLGAVRFGRPFMWRYACFLFGLVLMLSAYYLNVKQFVFIEGTRTSEQRILLIAPTQVHTFPKQLIFRWQEESDSQYYILDLFDNSLLPVWTSQQILDVQIQLPDEILSRLQSGNYYFWMITAFSSTHKISESELRRFLVLNK
jgi:hypothetical protein